MGVHKKDHIRAMLETPDVADKWRAAAGRDWAEADVEDLYRLVTPLQVEAASRVRGPVPGLRDALAKLGGRGIKIAATTGYFREAAEACYTRRRTAGVRAGLRRSAPTTCRPAGRPRG